MVVVAFVVLATTLVAIRATPGATAHSPSIVENHLLLDQIAEQDRGFIWSLHVDLEILVCQLAANAHSRLGCYGEVPRACICLDPRILASEEPQPLLAVVL